MPDKDGSICCRENVSKIFEVTLNKISKESLTWERKGLAGSSTGEVGVGGLTVTIQCPLDTLLLRALE